MTTTEKPFMQRISQLSGTADRLTASASVPADSIWYAGHFPGTPLLPGVAILALVEEAISEAEFREGKQVMMTGVGRVRFRLPVKPDDRMVMEISREKKNDGFAYAFSVFLSEELACTGYVAARVVAR
jgi:3-hydroxyacyl-[acyl-carrier-protein] dehydratase